MTRTKKTDTNNDLMENNKDEKKNKSNGKGSEKKEKKEIETLQQEVEEAKDKYLRLFAEFENYKKRNSRERFELIRTAAEDTIMAILPVLDDFDRAKKSAEVKDSGEYFSEGVSLVYHKLYSILKARGLEEMKTTGEDFNPEIHEAITEVPAPSAEQKGKIIDTLEKGYYLNDKIIRYPKVVVAT